MAVKYHVNPTTGRANICDANPNNPRSTGCKFKDANGIEPPHYTDKDEARAAGQTMLAEKHGVVSSLSKIKKTSANVESGATQEQDEAYRQVCIEQSMLALETYLGEELAVNDNDSFFENEEILTYLVQNENSSLQGRPIDEDKEFAQRNESINPVRRMTMADGSVGYFKPLREGAYEGMYGLTPMQEVANEVAAYKLSQVLGDGFDDLVPETTIRFLGGKVGSIQREATGKTKFSINKETGFSQDQEQFVDRMQLAHYAMFDYVLGNEDRHGNNYLVDSPPPRYVLIDNGFSFTPDRATISPTRFDEEDIKLTQAEMDIIYPKIQRLIDSSDSLGMDKYLNKASLDKMIERAKDAVSLKEGEEHRNTYW